MSSVELLTSAQLAKRLQVSTRTVYRMIREDMIPRKMVGGQWRFDLSEVLESLKSDATSRIPSSRGKRDEIPMERRPGA